jgi:8-oxo-dGTP pyrophosphatase MutT (NUDIX family)
MGVTSHGLASGVTLGARRYRRVALTCSDRIPRRAGGFYGGSVTPRYQLVPAAYVVLRRDPDEILLQLRRNTGFRDGFWATAAAGHVEKGESVLAAAVREAREELGVEIAPADLQPLSAMHRTEATGDPIDERVDFFFTCRRWTGTPRLLESAKAADLGWFRLDALPDPVVPHERAMFEALRGGGPPAITTHGF